MRVHNSIYFFTDISVMTTFFKTTNASHGVTTMTLLTTRAVNSSQRDACSLSRASACLIATRVDTHA